MTEKGDNDISKYVINVFMIKSLKKNQVIIFAIALMLVTVGYISYSMSTEQVAETSANSSAEQYEGIGDARLVSSNNVTENNNTSNTNNVATTSNTTNVTNASSSTSTSSTKANTTATSATSQTSDKDDYFAESRLEREKMYSEMLASHQSIMTNNEIPAEQKTTAQAEISKINKQRNAIMIAENLIKNKGFKDVVIFVNNESVSAVVRAEKLETAEIAQIQSIIQRELSSKTENIHISNK